MKNMTFIVQYFLSIFFGFFITDVSRANILEFRSEKYYIPINITFSGNRLKLYGATDIKGTIIIIVQGIDADFILKKKEKIHNIWREKVVATVKNIPSFYMLASSKPIAKNLYNDIIRNIHNTVCNDESFPNITTRKFLCSKIIHIKHRTGQYVYMPNTVKRLGQYLFSATINLPDDVPTGTYKIRASVQTNNGVIKGLYNQSFHIKRAGLVKYIYVFSQKYPTLYGIASILLTLCIGLVFGLSHKK